MHQAFRWFAETWRQIVTYFRRDEAGSPPPPLIVDRPQAPAPATELPKPKPAPAAELPKPALAAELPKPAPVVEQAASIALPPDATIAAPPEPLPPVKLPATKRKPKSKNEDEDENEGWRFGPADVEQGGTFYFKGAILDELGRYFKIIERFRKCDPGGYATYSRIGATIVAPKMLAPIHQLPLSWRERSTRPAFGCIWFGAEDTKDTVLARFISFNKMSAPNPRVEPHNSTQEDVYKIHMYWDSIDHKDKWRKRFFRKHGLAMQYYIAIDAKQNVRVLKQLFDRNHAITQRCQNYGTTNKQNPKTWTSHHTIYLPYREWALPSFLVEWWEEHRDRATEKWGCRDLHTWVRQSLVWTATHSEAVESGVRINVSAANGAVAVFAIDLKRTAYFFRDRTMTLNAKGSAARIFHVVRPHRRESASGERFVKMHFRGLRDFVWNGYAVKITLPGLHHTPINEFTVGASDLEAVPFSKDLIPDNEIAAALQRHIGGQNLTAAFNQARTLRLEEFEKEQSA